MRPYWWSRGRCFLGHGAVGALEGCPYVFKCSKTKVAVRENELCLGRVIQVKVRCNPKMTGIVVGNCDVCLWMYHDCASVGEISPRLAPSQNLVSYICK